ncbi:MAG: hypothetical protein JNJ46_24695 [Myxococcales bacterium]|nr:hypothetical protein [Myxococcales bacterium]
MSEPRFASPTAPNWVHDVGYANEKLHAGILARLIWRSHGDAQRDLINGLWQAATGCTLPTGPVKIDKPVLEQSLPGPRRSRVRLDLLISFRLCEQNYRLGLELKVDSPPDDHQLKLESDGMALEYPKDKRALVLLCLGAGQVGESQQPSSVCRWSLETLLAHQDQIFAALPNDCVVAGWLESLAIERDRQRQVLQHTPGISAEYRNRTFESYWLGGLKQALEAPVMPGISPWRVELDVNGPFINARGSWRRRQDGSSRTDIFLELHWECLYVKACARQGADSVIDPRPATASVTAELESTLSRLMPAGTVKRARYRRGDHNALLKLQLPRQLGLVEYRRILSAVAQEWDAVTGRHGFLRTPHGAA